MSLSSKINRCRVCFFKDVFKSLDVVGLCFLITFTSFKSIDCMLLRNRLTGDC